MIDCTQIQRASGLWYSAEYSTFSISDEVGKYRLTVAGYSGDAGDAMAAALYSTHNANGMKFSTPDSDNDNYPFGGCADSCGHGWWFNVCSANSMVNGIWTSVNVVADIQASRMLVKA